jgi:hypothetical protein
VPFWDFSNWLYAVHPVAQTAMAMCDCQNNGVRTESRVHNNEWELMESVSSAASEVDWPAIGSFGDYSYRSIKCVFEVDRRSQTSFPIPGQRRQIFLFRLPMKFKRLTCYSAAHALSVERRPMRSSSLFRIELLRGDERSLLAMLLLHFRRPFDLGSRSNCQRDPRAPFRVGREPS